MRRKDSALLTRVLSAAVLVPAVLVVLFGGGWWFFGFVLIVETLATWEYVRILRRLEYRPLYTFAAGMVWAILFDSFFPRQSYLRPALAILLLASLCWHILRDRTLTPVENWLLPLAGSLYIGWSGAHLLLLRATSQGAYRLFTVLCITWLADSGAYLAGRKWGKHQMVRRLSPKKTWEGMLGGIVIAVIGGTILTGLGGLGWWHGALLGLLLSTLAPVGDLGVSMIKRQAGVKNTGNLIPGHGGVLDRIDSMLVTAIIGYYYHLWMMSASPIG